MLDLREVTRGHACFLPSPAAPSLDCQPDRDCLTSSSSSSSPRALWAGRFRLPPLPFPLTHPTSRSGDPPLGPAESTLTYIPKLSLTALPSPAQPPEWSRERGPARPAGTVPKWRCRLPRAADLAPREVGGGAPFPRTTQTGLEMESWEAGGCVRGGGWGVGRGGELSQLGRLTATGSHALPLPPTLRSGLSRAGCLHSGEGQMQPWLPAGGGCCQGQGRGEKPPCKSWHKAGSTHPFPPPQEAGSHPHWSPSLASACASVGSRCPGRPAACVLCVRCGKENQKGESVCSQRLSPKPVSLDVPGRSCSVALHRAPN